MKAVTVTAGGLAFDDVAEPSAARGAALIRVDVIGLNRGDLRMAATMKPGFRLGWDFAGTIITGAGKGAAEGTRVAGLLPRMGAWAERIAAPAETFAAIPDSVSTEVAAALPSAGLTALYALESAGPLLGKRVLVTGASGGVGHLACQLAAIGGAEVAGLVRSASGAALLRQLGVTRIIEGEVGPQHGPFDVILDSVGGDTLSSVLPLLAPRGLCVAFGVTGGRDVRVDAFALYQQQWRLEGFGLFPAIERGKPVRDGLARLLRLVEDKRLVVHLGAQGEWTDIAGAAARLGERAFGGKAVLRVQG